MDLHVDLVSGGKRQLSLANPVMTASGTFGNGLEYQKIFDIQRLGAIVSKAITRKPRRGNVQPRIAETAAGMINSIGLQNIGLSAIIRDVAPVWETWQVPVVANIAGETLDDYAELASRLDSVAGVAAIEMNISCPNVESGLEFGVDPNAANEVTKAVRRRTDLPLIVKLTPNVTDIAGVASAIVDGGADALTLINTYPAMSIDVRSRRPALGWGAGGMSGPALKPIAVRLVYLVSQAVDVPIIGCGGITTGEDAVEFLLAGASAVQVGTATFRNPRAALDVLEGIEAYMRDEGVEDVSQLVGAAHESKAEPRPARAAG
ncbi:MAG: dihydroorotate dehydrogenase [Chloroflexi bacterium]|nr:dihydroorotate dehydrogenase [Chloroflexota bacterium]MCI0842613.1 dihydroorotate dehydrogenase [Chloroflexota bacterium]MCI0885557.1 dihydroorotate dehydrogenase [Chloroflexota bacterium]